MATTYTARSAQTPYLNAALKSICLQLLEDWGLSQEQISNLARDIPGECLVLALALPFSRANEMNLDLDGGRNG